MQKTLNEKLGSVISSTTLQYLMKLKHSPPMLLGLLLAFTFAPPFSVAQTMLEQQEPNVYVGIDIAYGGLAEIKSLVDQASTYTNLIVFGVTAVTNNETLLVPACQYSYDRGMYFIAYQAGWGEYNRPYWNSTYDDAKAAWGDHLLGVYQLDEPGGKEIDNLGTSGSYVFRYNRTFIPTTYSEFTTFYQQIIGRQISRQLARNETVFTSDYALYWFDYKAGYNCVLAEFTMKNNRQLAISLVRGAAEMQNKEWGVMITWDQDSPPYIESGKKLYQDMVLAYDNGAKYIVVFDANKDHTGSTLQPEHYLALQQFWQYTQSNPRKTDPINTRTGYVMPYGYGFGFRWSTDKVWGLPDPSSPFYYDSVNSLLQQYGTKLDIVYDDGLTAENVSKYASAIYHYSFTPPTPTATATPSQTPSPAPTQLATSTPTPEPTPSPSQTPTLSISPTPSPSPTQSPSPSIPELPTNISVAALILASTLALALIRKKHKDSSFP